MLFALSAECGFVRLEVNWSSGRSVAVFTFQGSDPQDEVGEVHTWPAPDLLAGLEGPDSTGSIDIQAFDLDDEDSVRLRLRRCGAADEDLVCLELLSPRWREGGGDLVLPMSYLRNALRPDGPGADGPRLAEKTAAVA